MRKIIVLITATIAMLAGCEDAGVPSQQPHELYQIEAINGVHIFEDTITGNLIYQEDGHGYMQVVTKAQLTPDQITSLKLHGYK